MVEERTSQGCENSLTQSQYLLKIISAQMALIVVS